MVITHFSSAKERETVVDMEKLVNQTVTHKSYGKGIIGKADEKYLEVDFMEKEKVRKFPCPSCFDGFLVLEDCGLQTEITSVVETWKVESGAESNRTTFRI